MGITGAAKNRYEDESRAKLQDARERIAALPEEERRTARTASSIPS